MNASTVEKAIVAMQRDWLRSALALAWFSGGLTQAADMWLFGPVDWSDYLVLGVCAVMTVTCAAIDWRRVSVLWVLPIVYLGLVCVGLAAKTGGPAGVTAFVFVPAIVSTIFFWNHRIALVLAVIGSCAAMVVIPQIFGDGQDRREGIFLAPLLPAVVLVLGALFNGTRGATREQERMRGTVAALLASLEARDGYTADHSSEVLELVRAVARRLKLGDRERQVAGYVGLLHDIGKIAIPNEVLNKEGPLTDDEWTVMREHPVIGESIVREIAGFGDVADAVRHEHERWDGKGYPDGIARDQIPIASRIVLACDAFHAMTSDRPYRKSIGDEAACGELVRCSGSQFDPIVVDALLAELADRRSHSRRTARRRARQVLADTGAPLSDSIYLGPGLAQEPSAEGASS